jgi:predicted transcriptional regulator
MNMHSSKSTVTLSVEIVTSFVSGNKVEAAQLPGLIKSVFQTLSGLDPIPTEPEITEQPSRIRIRKSITPDALISFIDGNRYKTLKRHLALNGMTIEDYRAKFGLPKDYPSVAPNYSLVRSELAKSLGLGRGIRRDKIDASAGPEIDTEAP